VAFPVVAAGPSAHDLAMESFEKGFRALQARSFKQAAGILRSMIERYPDEKELHDRARVYLAICDRYSDSKRDERPRTVEERMNAATVALNRGAFAEALELLGSVKREDGENDAVYYMLAVAHAGLGDTESAVTQLHAAIELNPDNRFLAAQDADLEALREHAAFVALLDSPPASRRRTATRTRPTR
jgi:tetratricopeptide (TPR) repeat protein